LSNFHAPTLFIITETADSDDDEDHGDQGDNDEPGGDSRHEAKTNQPLGRMHFPPRWCRRFGFVSIDRKKQFANVAFSLQIDK
jgi:hypothetical protein